MKLVLTAIYTTVLFSQNPHHQTTLLFSRLKGEWNGKGIFMGKPAKISMIWQFELQNKFAHLSYRVTSDSASGNTGPFEGKAFYKMDRESIKGTWFDSYGNIYTIKAAVSENSVIATWGPDGKITGKTNYRLIDNNTVEIADSVMTPGASWKHFGHATVKRK